MTLETKPLGNQVGQQVLGVDLAKPLSDSLQQDIYDLWLQHGLLLFKDQQNTPEVMIRFSKIFGELVKHPLVQSKEYPELFVVDNSDRRVNPVSYYDGEPVVGRLHWHKDLIYTAKPNRGAVLAPQTRPSSGGETGFIDQAQAYDSLSQAMKDKIEDLEVVYRFDVVLAEMRFFKDPSYVPGPGVPKSIKDLNFPDFPDSIYPLVIKHPETGRRILNVCSYFMYEMHDMNREQGDAILWELLEHLTRPERIYLHSWDQHDMLLWDNWRFTHCARGAGEDEQRFVNRTTIGSTEVLGRVAG
jgi:taurine dioxygenase